MELIDRDGLARICKISTPHGVIETPTVMPVINPNLNSIDLMELKKLGAEAVITNSYIIRRSEKLRERALEEGLHKLIGFDGPVMTDSGTFQSYVYGDFEFDNISQVQYQKDIGADIGTIVDIFSTPDDSYSSADFAVKETHRRYLEARRDDLILSAPVQGSVYMKLRRKAAKLMSSANPEYFAIGGVVPLLEAYRYDLLVKIIGNVKKHLRPDVPVHLFGAGHPMFISLAVLMGIDLFDSASYIKYARDGRLLYSDGTMDLKKVPEFPFWSPLYGKYTPSEVIDAGSDERTDLLSRHNLVAIFNEIREIKRRIREQTLWNYVEMKSRSHPAMFRAFKLFTSGFVDLQSYELSRKHPFYYMDRSSMRQPVARKLRKYIAEYLKARPNETIVVNPSMVSPSSRSLDPLKEIFENYSANVMVPWNGIPVPVELIHTYPVQQSVNHGLTSGYTESVRRFITRHTGNENVHVLPDPDGIEPLKQKSFRNLEREMLRVISEYQFGLKNASGFITDDLSIRISKKTGRIRTVSSGSDILATLRPADGFLTITYRGGEKLDRILPETRNRIYVDSDSVPFNSKGLNVFSKFVISADPGIVPGSEVLVKNEDSLIAVGHSFLNGREMMHFKRGLAVNVHQGRDSLS